VRRKMVTINTTSSECVTGEKRIAFNYFLWEYSGVVFPISLQ
jgi:hypothetical protein